MGDVQTRGIDWINQAPITIEARATSTASPDAVFAVLADHERWPEWFSGMRSVEVTGTATGVGARRRVRTPGVTVDEEFIAWEPGARFAFTINAARPRFVKSLVEDCRLQANGSGTDITYTVYLDPLPLLGPVMKIALQSTLNKGMKALAERAAR